jgi:DNA-binding beta-propeller fold protein YncE
MSRSPRRTAILSAGLLLLVTGCDDAPRGPAPGLLRCFGRTGQGPGEFSYPRAIAAGADGRVYIVDKAARIQCYRADGTFDFDWRTPVWDAGKPTGLGVAPDGRIFVADTHYSRVLVYSATGAAHAEFGRRGTGPGEFLMPTDVAVAADGTIYVGEYGGNDRISRFSPAFEYLGSFGGPGTGPAQLQRPQALLLDHDQRLWVADACNHRICCFDPDGTLRASFGHEGAGPGELRFPYGVDWLSDGTLVVAEYGNNRVQRFSRAGTSLGTWGRGGRRAGELAYPWAVAVVNDTMFILDSGNNRVQAVRALERATWARP